MNYEVVKLRWPPFDCEPTEIGTIIEPDPNDKEWYIATYKGQRKGGFKNTLVEELLKKGYIVKIEP